ncbi:MAG: magnesium transporter [Lachnospiraceae bacterium]|nr:magnesium transporter [Lachnospiraceae bacterium]
MDNTTLLFQQASEYLGQKNFSKLRELMANENPADLALLFTEFEEKDVLLFYRLLPKELASDTFSYMDSDMQEDLINGFSDKELREVLDQTFIDDTVDMIEEMPANVVSRILRNCDAQSRNTINQILKYPEDSAGTLMTIEYVNLTKNLTVKEAISRIRKVGPNKETIYTCYVTEARKLIGIVSVKDLLTAQDDIRISDIMETNLIFVDTSEDKEVVAHQFQKYDILALPVVDAEKRLVGIITFDDAMDVIQEENTEDISIMAAMTPSDDSYFKTGVFSQVKNRIAWLIILMLSNAITGAIINRYDVIISALPILVSFMPMLTGTGGNCGSQSSALMIRGLSLGEIKTSDFLKVMWKEFRIALVVSCILAVINGARILIFYHNPTLAIVLTLSIIATVILSKLIGCLLPIIAKAIHLDPAVMAGPLISTIVDICTTLLYYTIAIQFFKL